MIRRRSTLNMAQKLKRAKQVEIFSILDLCLQLPSDDKLLIRNQIKFGDEELSERILLCKKDKNFHSLQIYFRKYIQKYKQNCKFGFKRGFTPPNKSKPQTESSYRNSVQNSRQISPVKQYGPLDADKNLKSEFSKELSMISYRDDISSNSRQILSKELLKDSTLKNTSYMQSSELKNLLKNKIKQKNQQKPHIIILKFTNPKNNIENQSKQSNNILKQSVYFESSNNHLKTNENKYGQFYKRIKKVIQEVQ